MLLLELICVLLFLELVALIIASCGLIVLFPRAETHPAELILTNVALHVVAASALLYGPLTFLVGTHLRVYNDPGEVLALRAILLLPLLEHFTVSWPVLLVATLEAEGVAAKAVHDGANCVLLVYDLHGVVAVLGVRAPFDTPVVICE